MVRKKMLKPILKAIFTNFMKANFIGLFCIRIQANGMAVNASMARITANQAMYSGCCGYCIKEAMLFLKIIKESKNNTDVKKSEINAVE
jgi:hypothetical protein